MTSSFDIVAVAENNHYLVWQAMLFHYSCLHHLGHAPIIAVHADEGELLPGFDLITERGGRVQRLPNFRRSLGPDYPALNTAASLLHAESDADHVVLCDSDLVFLGPLDFERFAPTSKQLTFDAVNYLSLDDQTRELLEEPRRRAGVELSRLADFEKLGGVPHIVERSLRERLAEEWLRCVELFVPSVDSGRGVPWTALMWALVFAAIRLELEPVQTRLSISNFRGGRRLPDQPPPSIVHYCYGDSEFDKRRFGGEMTWSGAWEARAPRGSIHEAVCSQLRAAGAFYGLSLT